MIAQNRFTRALLSPFMVWVAVIAIGAYFMLSLDEKALKQPYEPGLWSTVKHYANALKFAHIKKGIDLAGGTYLVLGVEVEKAIENRLNAESRGLDQLFKIKDLKALPKTKEVKDGVLTLTFDTEDAARVCYNMLVDSKAQILQARLSDTIVKVTIAPELERRIRTGSVEQAVNVLTTRLLGTGLEGMNVLQHGDRQVVVQMPGLDDPERIKSLISKTALLEIKMVEKSAGSRDALLADFDGELPSDKMIIPGKRDIDELGVEESGRWYLVSAFPDMTGEHLVDARVTRDEFNKVCVSFKLDGVGAREFGELTANNVGRQLGIIIDNVMISAPSIKTEISGGSGIITGLGSQKEALDLSIVLKSGALSAPLREEHQMRVGASLGQDAVNKGTLACVVALLLLFVFSLLYYKIPGLFAVIALLVNMFLVFIFLSYFKATLSLSGVAGLILAVGVAIDASILIFERTKESLRAGVPLRKAIDDGFSGALMVIMDSNITAFLTGIILFVFGGPVVRNFATTWMLGIVATILAGIIFMRSLFNFFLDVFNVKSMRF